MGSRSTLAGKEVPISGTDSVKWIELVVPASPTASAADSPSPSLRPPTEDYASSLVTGDSTYLIWRIHKYQPNALEVMELCAFKGFPRFGLRIIFPCALLPFAFMCKNEVIGFPRSPYLLYALTISGVAYLLKLKSISTYVSNSIFPIDELIEVNVHTHSNLAPITAVTVAPGYLTIGRNDGSVWCFRPGIIDQSAPGFVHELRDDSGLGRLWGLMSRGKMLAAVQELAIAEVHGRQLLFVLHFDGILRIWDLTSYSRIFHHSMNIPMMAGGVLKRLWVGEPDDETSLIPLAIFYQHASDLKLGTICIHRIHYSYGDKIILSLESEVNNIPLEEGGCIDVKLSSDEIWILQDDGLVLHKFHMIDDKEEAYSYALQEEFVADQLFQSSEQLSNDLMWITYSLFSSAKEHMVPFVTSIFLRKLFFPGVYQNATLHATLVDYNRHLAANEFQSLTADGMRKEILSVVEHEVGSDKMSIFHCWKNFCTQYFRNWCKKNAPCGLLVDSSAGAVGLIRKNSVSVIRCLEDIERIIEGSSDEANELAGLMDLFDDDLESEILMEVLRCVTSFSQHLGKAASAIFYESLMNSDEVSSEYVISCMLKILETGCSTTDAILYLSAPGDTTVLKKESLGHRNLRKFSIDMLLSLHSLCNKATRWDRVLNVIESFLKFLVPQKIMHKFNAEISLNINSSILVHATSQIAKVMFESALDFLLYLSYLVDISGQINMLHDDITKIQLELVPMIQEIILEWLVIIFVSTTSSVLASTEDFSYKLSSLQIDSNMEKCSMNEKFGRCDFTLAFMLMVNMGSSSIDQNHASSKCLSSMQNIVNGTRDFVSWIIWGRAGESSSFLSRSNDLALLLLRNGQYEAAEYLLTVMDAHSCKEKTSQSIQDTDGEWCILHHILGCCLLALVRCGLHGALMEKKVNNAVRSFFRASSGQGAQEALQNLSYDAGLPPLGSIGSVSSPLWLLHYYQWAMQIFEQYNISEGAFQFALAALEQADECLKDGDSDRSLVDEPASTIKGRLWANVFKFALDLGHYHDAYCAIISNPDGESKYICLRRFIIVLYERGALKILCDNQLPLPGLTSKVEQELAWKAAHIEIYARPNLYKLLYAFEMYRHNWRQAASYMYLYSSRLRTEAALKDHHHSSLILQERLNGLSTAINALHLVHPSYAWINTLIDENTSQREQYPSKKAKITVAGHTDNDAQPQGWHSYINLEELESEYVLTSAEHMLSLVNIKWPFTGTHRHPSDLVDILVQKDLYDMAFIVLLRFFKDSDLKRELEKIFFAMSLKCCPHKSESRLEKSDHLLTSPNGEVVVHGSPVLGSQQSHGNSWATLELYLEKYRVFHSRLPLVVAETLLRADPQIELPLWLVQMFKEGLRENAWGMAGRESNPASLFRLYVNFGRFTEATNMLLDFIESLASMRPADIIKRKRPFAVWFPYTTIQRLLSHLDGFICVGHMVNECEKLKKLLCGALQSHLQLLKVDSDDVLSSFGNRSDAGGIR